MIPAVFVSFAGAAAMAGEPWKPDAELLERLRARRPAYLIDEEKVPAYELPDILRRLDGHVVTSAEDWPARREEIVEQFRRYVYGHSPGAPEELRFGVLQEDPKAMDGRATLRRIAIHSRRGDRKHQFELILFLPNARGERPSPVFLLINNRPPENIDYTREKRSEFWPVEEMIARGYGMATFYNRQLAPDDTKTFRQGVISMFEGDAPTTRPADAWGAIGAWSWGASRAMDYFHTDGRVDAKKVAVVGHSRGGKTALWTGAQDERFALTISNNSGCTGAALHRRTYGETIRVINRNTHWFNDTYKTYNDRDGELPVDQHMLIASIAPRAVYVTSATEDLWADPRGEFLALAHASPAYGLFGHPPIAPDPMVAADTPLVSGPRGYHIRTGAHNMTLYDWMRFADFADRLWPQ